MNDDDYIAVLQEELDEITAELEEVRAYRDKRKKLIKVLQEEQQALEIQKEERLKRSEILHKLEDLEAKYKQRKKERNLALTELTVAVKSYNRLLIATGRPPLDEPVQGRILPKEEIKKLKKNNDSDDEEASSTLKTLPLVTPVASHGFSQHSRATIATTGNLSLDTEPDILAKSSHSAGDPNASKKLVVNGILKKRLTPLANPKRPVAKLKKKQPKTKASNLKKPTKNEGKEDPKKESELKRSNHGKTDGQGDMSNFLDAIGYYSPEEAENN